MRLAQRPHCLAHMARSPRHLLDAASSTSTLSSAHCVESVDSSWFPCSSTSVSMRGSASPRRCRPMPRRPPAPSRRSPMPPHSPSRPRTSHYTIRCSSCRCSRLRVRSDSQLVGRRCIVAPRSRAVHRRIVTPRPVHVRVPSRQLGTSSLPVSAAEAASAKSAQSDASAFLGTTAYVPLHSRCSLRFGISLMQPAPCPQCPAQMVHSARHLLHPAAQSVAVCTLAVSLRSGSVCTLTANV